MKILPYLFTFILGLTTSWFYLKPQRSDLTQTEQQQNCKVQDKEVSKSEPHQSQPPLQNEKPSLKDDEDSSFSSSEADQSNSAAAIMDSGREDNSGKYFFTDIRQFSPQDINFEAYFEKIDKFETDTKINSIESAYRSGLIQKAVVAKSIMSELTKLIENPQALNDSEMAVSYASKLVQEWKLNDPDYIKPELLQHFKDTVGSNLKEDNPVFNQLKIMIGEN